MSSPASSPASAQNKEIDCLSPEAQRLAEARLAAKRAARAEAREIRMRELERQQKEVEERPEKDFTEKGSRNMPGLSAATLASLGGTSSRRGSGDTSISMDTEASIREIKDSLAEVEEKYKKAMVSNAQLDNEKTNFMYQVDTLKDTLLELEEQLAESQRLYEEKSKELERERHAHSVLQFQFAEVKEALRQREEMLEKHGIIVNSEIATNGETSDTLNNVGYQGPTKMAKDESHALQSAGDGTLGRANGVEVKKEIVETVGKRETLQNAEQEQHREHAGEECVDVEGLPPAERAEGRASSEHRAASPEREGRVQGRILGNTSVLESPEQVGSNKVADMLDGGTRASPERSGCLQELGGDLPSPVPMQDSGNASDTQNDREKSVVRQDREKQEDLKTDTEKSCQDPIPGKLPETEKINGTISGDPDGDHMENEAVAKGPEVGEQADTAAGNLPAVHRGDTANPDGRCVAAELDPSTGPSMESKLPSQEGAEIRGTPVPRTEAAGEGGAGEEGDTEPVDEQPVQTGALSVPRAPAAMSSPSRADSENEADAGKNLQPAEALDSSQKKTKNKRKKNKRKKTPAPAETPQDVKDTLACRHTDAGEAEEEEQAPLADKSRVTKALHEVTENPKQQTGLASKHADCRENPEIALDGTVDQAEERVSRKEGEGTAEGDALPFEDDTVPSAGAAPRSALDEQTTKEQSGSANPENEIGNSSPLPESKGPSQGGDGAEHSGQAAAKVLDSIGLDNDNLSASTGEPGDLDSEGRGRPRVGSERGRSKEDCTMS